jgi:hypothetical protein
MTEQIIFHICTNTCGLPFCLVSECIFPAKLSRCFAVQCITFGSGNYEYSRELLCEYCTLYVSLVKPSERNLEPGSEHGILRNVNCDSSVVRSTAVNMI